MPVDHGKEKIIVLAQVSFDAADHHRAVRVAYFLGDDADGIGSFEAQGASEKS